MDKHTPGPWFVAEDMGDIVVQWTSGPHSTYYITQAVHSPGPNGECPKANARLIAAAPELLEALQALRIAELEDCSDASGILALRAKADAAIAKATGEQP